MVLFLIIVFMNPHISGGFAYIGRNSLHLRDDAAQEVEPMLIFEVLVNFEVGELVGALVFVVVVELLLHGVVGEMD